MRSKVLMSAAVCAALLALTACHSSESQYKKAYEKAQAEQLAEQQYAQQNAQENTPVEVTAVTPTVTPTTDYSNVSVRSEDVSLVNGAGLKAYSVVVGSFGMLSNAQGLQSSLQGRGFGAQIVQATVNGQPFYRVVATTYDTKEEAVQSRANLMQEFPGTWLLYQK
ncbi:MAG: SPOR domain-containing protein [Prevotellaceae bacterium]|nr:SPOR domain-containing protein [Prevotellaceae bacterium]MCD8285076.1 SPOR domain-containing protein [Prevotellaceae bacterium]MCD8304068.1 SPOR domain-containing protein [Prevotellaceae bacterium]